MKKSKQPKLKVRRHEVTEKPKAAIPPRKRTSIAGKFLLYAIGRCDTVTYNGKVQKKSYHIWHAMLQRCYDPRWHTRYPAYIGCTVSKPWLKYSTFERWFDKHYVEGYHLDKDILIPGNREYGPATCCFVPRYINMLLTDSKRARGKYPQGVSLHSDGTRLAVQMLRYGKKTHLGTFKLSSVAAASECYTKAKRAYIREVAEAAFSDKLIAKNVYRALITLSKVGVFK